MGFEIHLGVFVFVLGLCVGFGSVDRSRDAKDSYLKQCESTRIKFVSSEIGSSNIVPSTPIHDPEMEICYKGSQSSSSPVGCCSRKMEKRYHSQASDDFFSILHATSSHLKGLLSSNSALYKEQLALMVRNAENNTDALFREVFKINAADKSGPLRALFVDLQEFLQGRPVNIHETVATFFNDLFPLVIYNNLNDPQLVSFDKEYRMCLTEARESIYPHPFGEVPNQLSHQLSKSMSTARTFLEALALAIETVNMTDNIDLESQCSRALTRMQYCPTCQGFVDAQPCRHYCYNVMRGCLATTAEVDRHWNSYMDSIKGLTINMKGYYNLEDALNNLHTRIYEAILHAMETGHKFYSQVEEKCGHPSQNKGPTVKPTTTYKETTLSVSRASTQVTMDDRFDNFMRSLMASKGFYRSLADTMCSNKMYAVGTDHKHCWNGESLNKYNKTLTEVDLLSQMESNPEMHITGEKQHKIKSTIEKLIQMKKELQSKISLEMMQADGWESEYNQKVRGRGRKQRKDPNRDYYGTSGDGWSPRWTDPGNRPSYDEESGDDYPGGRYRDEYSGNGGYGYDPHRDDESSGDNRWPSHRPSRPDRPSWRKNNKDKDPNDDISFDEDPPSNSDRYNHDSYYDSHSSAPTISSTAIILWSLYLLLVMVRHC